MKLFFKLFAPYLAVLIFWNALHSAWLTILCYHALILILSRDHLPRLKQPFYTKYWLFILPTLATVAVAYFLIPYICKQDITSWLEHYHLEGISFLLMIPYFGMVHPFLEEAHWSEPRDQSWLSHIAFAGYHLIVLNELLSALWLVFCFVVLLASSMCWKKMTTESKSLLPASFSHLFADLGIILAAGLLK